MREVYKVQLKQIVDVYVAPLPKAQGRGILYPPERRKEVDVCTHEQVKRQKYYAWKLLEYALERSFGYKIAELSFEKDERGKWTSPACCFSLSHSENALAVAVSRTSVGVDIELVRPQKNRFIQKVLTKEETEIFSTLPVAEQTDYLIGKWAEKESVFKSLALPRFRPSEIQTGEYTLKRKKITLSDETYMLSVAGDFSAVRFFENISLAEE